MLKFPDRVKEATATTGTGAFALSGASSGFRTFAASLTVGDTVPYCAVMGVEFEVGTGTLTAATTLARTTVTASSNAGALVNFSAGAKEIFATVSGAQVSAFLSATDGTTLEAYLAANPGSTLLGADKLAVIQDAGLKGSSLSDFATFVNGKWPDSREKIVQIATTTPFPLDSTQHNRAIIEFQVGGTVTGPLSYATVGDRFRTEVVNISGSDVTLGSGITCKPASAGNKLSDGARAVIYANSSTIYALMPAAAVVQNAVAPGQVTGLALDQLGPNSIRATWVAPTTGTAPFGYTIQYRANATGSFTVAATGVSALIYTIASLSASTSYEVQVIATNSAGPGTASAGVSASTTAALAVPGQVTGLTLGTATNAAQPLTWTAPSSGGAPSAYTVEYRVTSVGGAYTVANTTATGLSYSVTGLTASTGYDYRVTASNATGPGTPSAVASGSTAAAPVAPFTASNRSGFPTAISTLGNGNFYWTDIVATGAATITKVEMALTTSSTAFPTNITTSTTTSDTNIAQFYSGAWIANNAGSTGLTIANGVASATNFYFWVRITDSNAAVHLFRRATPINIYDSCPVATATVAESLVAA